MKMLYTTQIIRLILPALASAATSTYAVPASAPTGAKQLDPAPVGVSLVHGHLICTPTDGSRFEFFAFPSYFTNVTATNQCLKNFQQLTGTWPPIRIGGTTQWDHWY
jgi:hypothetical protein